MQQQHLPAQSERLVVTESALLETHSAEASAAVDSLLAELHAEVEKRRQRTKWLVIGIVAYIVIVIGIGVASKITTGKVPPGFGAMFSWMGGVMAALSAMSQTQRKATKKLAGEDDPRAVGFLSEALYSNDKELASASADALKRLLPRLQASDAALLNADQRAALRKAAQGKDAALALAVIGAWRQVGDEHDLAATRTIAQGEGRASLVAVLQPAAQETLPFLQQRVEAKRQSDTLLRAAEGYVSETAPDTLLRPAENAAGQTPPQQLLRPATGDDAP